MNEHERQLRREADRIGAVLKIERTSRHFRAVARLGERSVVVIFPCTPSENSRGPANSVAQLRRALVVREAVRTDSKHAPRPKRKAKRVCGTAAPVRLERIALEDRWGSRLEQLARSFAETGAFA